ncbi:cobalamin B12-binding domain-containing protein [Aerophototrophica crusticola]|uniref:Cobalamin B12-binding domain-containing protein n=1 Tax=Aerophototrophica crusticola TaxID=1709002 RepID=A0A858RBB6_9PROT|nr:cobalamin B12-binding domain-containing protein [Rhodospirillaceae bacterium B3]
MSLGLRGTVEAEVVPRLLLAHGATGKTGGPSTLHTNPVRTPLHGDDVVNLAGLLLAPEMGPAQEFVQARVRLGARPEHLFTDLLAPAARHLGYLWEQDLCDFGDVTVGMCHLRTIMRDMSSLLLAEAEPVDPRRRVLLLPTPGDQHSFGLFMVAEFFRRAGWDVTTANPSGRDELAALVREQWYAVVGLSGGSGAKLDMVAGCIRAVRKNSRNRSVGVMVGGPIFTLHPDYVGLVGADDCAVDGRQAPVQAEKFIA